MVAVSLQEKQALINQKLKRVNARYGIVNLRLTDARAGRYDFDIVTPWKRSDEEAVHQVFRSVLGSHKASDIKRTVKTSILLPEPVYEKLQSLKHMRSKSQSQVVAELIRNA